MTQNTIPTKWRFIVEFEDNESRELAGTIGQAETYEECEASMEDEALYHRSRGRTVVNLEIGELCAACDGEGQIPAGNAGRIICQACGGNLGPISQFVHLKS
jgi:hypothetical protein